MTKRTRRTHSAGSKAKVTLAAIKGEKPLAELARLFDVPHASDRRLEGAVAGGVIGVFGPGTMTAEALWRST